MFLFKKMLIINLNAAIIDKVLLEQAKQIINFRRVEAE